MSEFTFSWECLETSIGTVDVTFDVEFEKVSDESGSEIDWNPSSPINVQLFDEDGEIVREFETKYNEPLYGEILKLCEDWVLDECANQSW